MAARGRTYNIFMLDDAAPHHSYLKFAIAFATIAAAALAFVAWRHGSSGEPHLTETPAPLTDEDKLDIMKQLSASIATSVANAEKEDALTQLRASTKHDTDKDAKTEIMQSLHAN